MTAIKRALISVSDKTGIVDFARDLRELGVEILSTGGTAKLLADNDVDVIEVSDYTGFPEIMDGRVKTLQPKIHGGLLAVRANAEHQQAMKPHGIKPIDLLVVNLYPFEATVAKGAEFDDCIENIDIGGPTMLRSAAKNHKDVTVIVNADDYARVLEEMAANNGAVSEATRFDLAVKVFEHTSNYDGAIANYLGERTESGEPGFPRTCNLQFQKVQAMRYGENPHQTAALQGEAGSKEASNSTARQLQGKALSYNNIGDTDAARECVKQYSDGPTCVIVKHANPCGVAMGSSNNEAYMRAFATDPVSSFGGIIAFNQLVQTEVAASIIDQQFVEVVIAPDFSDGAIERFATKPNVRLLRSSSKQQAVPGLDFKRINGGLLVQDRDLGMVDINDLQVVTEKVPSEDEMRDLLFAWKVAKFVKSNAIVYVKNCMTIGVGAGQMSRVYSAKIAGIKAADENLQVAGSVMASDAFFPFRDGIDAAHEAGIRAVIQPGGSMRDDEVIAAANEHGMAMVFTSMRHFRH